MPDLYNILYGVMPDLFNIPYAVMPDLFNISYAPDGCAIYIHNFFSNHLMLYILCVKGSGC